MQQNVSYTVMSLVYDFPPIVQQLPSNVAAFEYEMFAVAFSTLFNPIEYFDQDFG